MLAALGVLLVSISLSSVKSWAEEYPSRTIKMVVPFEAGGGTDLLARIIGEKLSEYLHRPVIIDNRPGAATQLGAEIVARAASDGYTLLSSSLTTFAFNPSLYKKLPYDPVKDFAAISLTGRFAFLLVANPAFPANSLSELIAMAKAAPDKLAFASAGPGSPHQMAMELLLSRADVRVIHVPYKGAAPALKDVISGDVPVMMLDMATAREPVKAGLLKVLASASPQRLAKFRKCPPLLNPTTPVSKHRPGRGSWHPRKRHLRSLNVREKLQAAGIEPIKSTPEEFAAYIQSETQKWRDVIKAANISLN